MRKSKFSEK